MESFLNYDRIKLDLLICKIRNILMNDEQNILLVWNGESFNNNDGDSGLYDLSLAYRIEVERECESIVGKLHADESMHALTTRIDLPYIIFKFNYGGFLVNFDYGRKVIGDLIEYFNGITDVTVIKHGAFRFRRKDISAIKNVVQRLHHKRNYNDLRRLVDKIISKNDYLCNSLSTNEFMLNNMDSEIGISYYEYCKNLFDEILLLINELMSGI